MTRHRPQSTAAAVGCGFLYHGGKLKKLPIIECVYLAFSFEKRYNMIEVIRMLYAALLLAGILQGVMVSLNSRLGQHFSLFGVSFFVHGIALVILLVYMLLKRQKPRFRGAPWYVYLVGLFGIGIVSSSAMTALHIGAAAMIALNTAGELLAAWIIDHFGLFGMPKAPFSKAEIPGYLLVALGVVLIMIS